ncbi:GspE/PulE family protein [Patescibacteria group bacterium]
MPDDQKQQEEHKQAKLAEIRAKQQKSAYRLPGKKTKAKIKDIKATEETTFDILDPEKRDSILKKLRERPESMEPEDLAFIEQRMLTAETDEFKIEAEKRKAEEKQAAMTAQDRDLPFINLYGFPIGMKPLEKIPEEDALKNELMPFYFDDIELRVGTPNPKNETQDAYLKKLSSDGLLVTKYYISESSYNSAIKYYKDVQKDEVTHDTEKVEVTEELLGKISDHVDELKNVRDRLDKMSVTKVLDLLFGSAVKLKASDVHFEPAEKTIRLRFRIDGVLQDVMDIKKKVYKQVLSRIKLIGHMKVNVSDIPQDGRISITLPDKVVDVRVSILPSGNGESIVARLLGVGAVALDVEQLGLRDPAKSVIEKQLEKPYGMVLTTGPTGSGKTTTLYSFLNFLNEPDVKIITLEDPIEYRLKGIQQTQINRSSGLDFAAGLRSILRHDPDVVLVGEIRDLETAEIAINAAQTGHFVFSTLHTNDAAGVLPRLINMGLRQFVIAPAINAVIAQRLVRVLCDKCKIMEKPTPAEMKFVDDNVDSDVREKYMKKDFQFGKPKGCDVCATGYKGRLGIYEVFEVGDDMEKLIMRSATVAEIREQAIANGMVLMKQDGIIKASEGITTLEEIRRVTAT